MTESQETPAAHGAGAFSDEQIAAVEAVLFSTDAPLTPAKIVEAAELPGRRAVTRAVEALNERYERGGAAFRIEAIAGGYRMQTLGRYHQVLLRLFKARSETKLSRAAMETLAIVAYRQPVLRADIEAIRGVASGEVLRGLIEKQLVKIAGRAEVLGRPMLYGTTRRFMEIFGLKDLDDLPRVEEFREAAKKAQVAREEAARSEAESTGHGDDAEPRGADNQEDADSQG